MKFVQYIKKQMINEYGVDFDGNKAKKPTISPKRATYFSRKKNEKTSFFVSQPRGGLDKKSIDFGSKNQIKNNFKEGTSRVNSSVGKQQMQSIDSSTENISGSIVRGKPT